MMKKTLFIGLLTVYIGISSSLPVDKKIDEYLTENEQRYILNAKPGVNPEYELTNIKVIDHTRNKRGIFDSIRVLFSRGGEDYELLLEENDHALYGSDTSIYLATGHQSAAGEYIVKYKKQSFPLPKDMKVYHDRSKRAAVTIHKDDDGRMQINGKISDEHVIRSLPSTIRQRIPGFDNHHILLKAPQEKINELPNKIVTFDNIRYNKLNFPSVELAHTNKRVTRELDPDIKLLKFPEGTKFLNVKQFIDLLRNGRLQRILVNGVVKEAPEILQAIKNQGFLEPEEINDFATINFPSGTKIVIDVNTFKQSLIDNQPITYERGDGKEKLSHFAVLQELKKQGIVVQAPKGDTVYPELLITMDFETVERFNKNIQEITKYMVSFWNAVDLLYRELESPRVRINIAGIIIPQNREAAEYLNHQYHHNDLNNVLGSHFIKSQNTFPFDTYDIVVGFLNLKFLPGSDTVVGQATTAASCANKYGKATEIIGDIGNFGSVNVAVHELGHNLGAILHDDNCTSGDNRGYIMEAESSNIAKNDRVFHWSSCSKFQISKYLRDIQATCLYNKPKVGVPYQKILPGRLMNRDQQCQTYYGNSQYFSPKHNFDDCLVLECERKGYKVDAVGIPAEGTSCGNEEICLRGKCALDIKENSV